MNKRELQKRDHMIQALERSGIDYSDIEPLRRISMTLHRWAEHECNGVIQRDDDTGKPFAYSDYTGKRLHAVADREAGALKRLEAYQTKYPTLNFYVQGDPRGCALYAVENNLVPTGERIDSYYSRGIAIY